MPTSTTDFTWGVNAHDRSWNMLSTSQELDVAQSMGLKSLRVDIYDASASTMSWLSSLVTEASSRGMTIMPVILPDMSVITDESSGYAWGQQVGSALAAAFPHLTWEAGNELDEFAINDGTTGQSASDYDDGRYGMALGAIKGLTDGIHQADSTAQVAVGITGLHFAFLQRLASDGASWDITSEHYYIGHGDTQIPQELEGVISQVAQFNKPILMTEFNQVDGSMLSATEEANTLVAMMSTMQGLAAKYHVIGGYIYELLDEPSLAGGEAHYGLANQTGTLNPAGLAVQQYLASLAATGSSPTVVSASGPSTVDGAGSSPSAPASSGSSSSESTSGSATLTDQLAHDTGLSSTDNITSDPTLAGSADPNATVNFAVDGAAPSATTTADASGAWSFSPSGLSDGQHTIVASETDASGNTVSSSLTFTLDTQAPQPVFTELASSNGETVVSGTTGGPSGETVQIFDGKTSVGTATTGSDGSFSLTFSADPAVKHAYTATATDIAGNVGNASGKAYVGSTGHDHIVGSSGPNLIEGGGGADTLTGGSGQNTFTYTAASDSTPAAPDKITNFIHGTDKIDFTNIAGINATNGVPQFQGNLLPGHGQATLDAHSVGFFESHGNTVVLVNTSATPETVSRADTHSADMKIVLTGVNLHLSADDFHHS
ncbi:MAG: M10 family metallopeptidase C-terminal domain-containing protein [Alphaproteobacteria bacterium]|nr:M10 family metallopeptidase C-terminal domain-containing protein [Alphaproteobacteria bacterium]